MKSDWICKNENKNLPIISNNQIIQINDKNEKISLTSRSISLTKSFNPKPPNKKKKLKKSEYSFHKLTPFKDTINKEDMNDNILELCNNTNILYHPKLIKYPSRHTIISYLPPEINRINYFLLILLL